MDNIKKHLGGTYNINYHIVFCPKRRRAVLVDDIALSCKNIITDIVQKVNGQIESLEVMPDHVHIFVSIHPKISPHILVKQIKGATSNKLRKTFPQLLKLPTLWSSSYYIGTVGHVSESVVRLYIENQKNK